MRFRGGLVFKAHRLLHHSTLGSRVIEMREEVLTKMRETVQDRWLKECDVNG